VIAQAAADLADHLVVDYDFAFAVLDDEPVAPAALVVPVDELAVEPGGPAELVGPVVLVVLAAVPEDAAVVPGRALELAVAVAIVVDGFAAADDFVDEGFEQTVIVVYSVIVAAENLVAKGAEFAHVDRQDLVLTSVV